MKFTATVVSVISHDRLNDAGARVKYKDVLTLSVNAPAPKGGGPHWCERVWGLSMTRS